MAGVIGVSAVSWDVVEVCVVVLGLFSWEFVLSSWGIVAFPVSFRGSVFSMVE